MFATLVQFFGLIFSLVVAGVLLARILSKRPQPMALYVAAIFLFLISSNWGIAFVASSGGSVGFLLLALAGCLIFLIFK